MLDIDTNRLSGALKDIYAATVDPTDRALLPHKIACLFGAASGQIQTRDDAGVTIIAATENVSMMLPEYIAYYHALDAWSERGSRRLNQAVLGDELVPNDELLRTEWYNNLLRKAEVHHLVGAAFKIEFGAIGVIGIHRAAKAAGFGESDRAMMNLLLPHLRQALHLMRSMDASERTRRLSFDALAALSVGVFVVAADGAVRMMNAAAEQVLRSVETLKIRNRRLTLSNPGFDNRLRAAIGKASLAPLGRSVFAGETIVVPTANGYPLSLLVVPLPPEAAQGRSVEPLAAAFVNKPNRNPEPSLDLIRATFSLTPAEIRVLRAILNGKRPVDYAAEAGLSQNTVATQMKSIFAKMGCHHQADLVRMLLSDPLLRLSQNLEA